MAAGQGFKTFVTGEVLTAGDVNGYLMQGINVFTNATARDAAITAPAEGQFAFTKDNNSLWYYDGAAWVASGATGDIEGVTAGVGISGGGTSGTVTVTNSMATAIDAKGDLVPGTGADTFARLAVGANDTILTADSSTATGLKWAAPAGGSKVVQIVTATTNTPLTLTTSTPTDTGLTATITPTNAANRILIFVNQNGVGKSGNTYVQLRLNRPAVWSQLLGGCLNTGGTTVQIYGVSYGIAYNDLANTTSAITYLTTAQNANATGDVRVQFDSTVSTMILMEVLP